jgi:hypothetical protein
MSTNTKIYLALGLAAAAVFAATVIKMSVPDDAKADTKSETTNVPIEQLELLRADIEHIYYNPLSDRAAFREYPGYYEQNEHQVPLWFCNPNPVPITMSFQKTSCAACSFADVAVVPTPKIDPNANPNPFGSVLGGVMGRSPNGPDDPVPFGWDIASHNERTKIYSQVPQADWKRIVAANSTVPGRGNPGGSIEFPAAISPDQPTWGVLRLNIKVNESKTLEATIAQKRPDMAVPALVTYRATVGLAQFCEVIPATVPLGELGENSPPLSETIYYFSSTRTNDGEGDAKLPLPVVSGIKGDPFLTLGPPIPMTVDEQRTLAERLTASRKIPSRVTGGYKLKMTLSRKALDPVSGKMVEIDLGPATRVLTFAPETGVVATPPKVTVTSSAVGAVTLEDMNKIDLQTYPTRIGVKKTIRLSSLRPGIELEVVPSLHDPKHLRLTPVSNPVTKDGRTVWTMLVEIPPGEGGGRLPDGSVVTLRIKSTGQLVRLPVAGNGH